MSLNLREKSLFWSKKKDNNDMYIVWNKVTNFMKFYLRVSYWLSRLQKIDWF